MVHMDTRIISMSNDMISIQAIFKALGDLNRLRILKIIQHRAGCCECEIQHVLGIGQSTTSRHLAILEKAGLVRSGRDGKWINYHLATDTSPAAREALELLAHRLDQDPQVQKDRQRLDGADRVNICCRPVSTRPRSQLPKRAAPEEQTND